MTATPTRTECEAIVARLWPHLDGALPESEHARVVAHLERCDGCRSHYDFAQAFLDAVHRAAPEEDDARFAALRTRVERAVADAARTDP